MAQFPIRQRPGTQILPTANVPNGATQALITLDGSTMTDPALFFSLTLDFSIDDGATWASTNRGPGTDPYPVTAEMQGGSKDKHGNPIASYDIQVVLPSPDLTTRKVRGSVTVSGATLNTTATLTIA